MVVYSFFEVGLSLRHTFRRMLSGSGLNISSIVSSIHDFRERNQTSKARKLKQILSTPPLRRPCANMGVGFWPAHFRYSHLRPCALASTQFHMNVGEVILALIFGFIFSFLAVQSSGNTDLNPVSTCAKASQLTFGGIGKAQNYSGPKGEMINLIACVLAAGSAAQASNMTGDLKTGHLLRAKPKHQFVAQLCGATVAVFLKVGLFILFCKSAPCILHPSDT